jgi:hypothetical protein
VVAGILGLFTSWWRVRTEGFLCLAGAVAVFFAFNLFAFNYLPRPTSTGSF